MKKTVFLLAIFVLLTGFVIDGLNNPTNKHKASWGKYFYAYVYGAGSSLDNELEGENYVVVYEDGDESVLKIDYTVAKDGGAGLGLDAPGGGNSILLDCESFKYDYKGGAHNFKVELSTVTDDATHFKAFGSSSDWATAIIEPEELEQPEWGNEKPYDASKVTKFAWEVQATGTGSLAIKNFECTGVDLPSSSSANSSSSVTANSSSSSYSGERTIIDDFGKTLSPVLNDYWYIYTDADGGGESTVANVKSGSSYKVITQEEDGNWVGKIEGYSLSKGDSENAPYVAMGIVNKTDLSTCAGFEYKYKGAAHNFKVELSTVSQAGANHFKKIDSSTDWATATITSGELEQPDWAKPKVSYDASEIAKFAWEVKDSISAETGDLAIDDFTCLGTIVLPSSSSSAPAASSSSSLPVSSSSSSIPASSSSSSSVGTSSSSAERFEYCVYVTEKMCTKGPFSVCQANGLLSNDCPYSTTPILSQQVFKNLQAAANTTIQIFDLKGNIVSTPASNLPPGLYIVKAWNQTIKVVVR